MEHSILRIRVLFWLCIFLFCACIIICDPLKVDILSTYDTPQEKDALPCIFRKKRDSLLVSLRFVYIYIKYIYIYIYIYIGVHSVYGCRGTDIGLGKYIKGVE